MSDAAPAPAATASAPATSGAPSAPSGSGGALSSPTPTTPAKTPAASKLTPAEQRFLFQRAREDGTMEDIDITGFKTKIKADGREIEIDLPRLVKLQQLEHTSNARLMEHRREQQKLKAEQERFQQQVKNLDDPDRLLGYLADKYAEHGIYDKLSALLAERVRFERLPRAEQERIVSEQKQRKQHQQERQQLEQEKRELAQWKAERARAEQAERVKGWKAQWPEEFKQMGLPIGEHIDKDGNDTIFAEAFNRTLTLARQNQQLKLGKTWAQCKAEAVGQVRGILDAAGKLAAREREASIQKQPGRTEEEPAPDNVRPIGTAKQLESTSDFLDRLRGR